MRISAKVGKSFIRQHHYSRSIHNGPMCYGLFSKYNRLIGVCAFACPCSENVRSSVFGEVGKDWVFELHRLAILDGSPKNTASWFIKRAIQCLQENKSHLRALLSFADSTEGHFGYIYQATNFLYCGTTEEAWFYRDSEHSLRHPRQNSVNISFEQADEMGWKPEKRASKHRYVLILNPPPTNQRTLGKSKWKQQTRAMFVPEFERLIQETYPKASTDAGVSRKES